MPPITKPRALDNPELEPAISGLALTALAKAMGTIKPCAKNNIIKGTITLISVTSRALTRK